MSSSRLAELQDEIVLMAAEAIEGDWAAAVVNVEVESFGDSLSVDSFAFYYVKRGGSWVGTNFSIMDGNSKIAELIREFWRESVEEKWSSFTLEFEPSGRYRFSFGFGPAPRSNGIFDDTSMLKNYTPAWD